tara:strand:- start:1061 stop:1357 length:297 start_codon:yes stop_codon:yes gene_type:complete
MSIYKTKMVNGKEVELTATEISDLEKRDKEWSDGEYDRLMASIRQERTDLLMECDWMGMSDLTMSDAWKTYRQKLRDITKDVDTVDKAKAVTMPEKPK